MSGIDITCYCPTHGRPYLLAEAVESFRRQRLGGLTAELLIVNDCPEQTLTCDVPGVRIVQGMEPFADMREKNALAFSLARGDWLAFWDDDDISLPDRLRYSMGRVSMTWPRCAAVRVSGAWRLQRGWLRGVSRDVYFCTGMIRRDVLLACGMQPPEVWIDEWLAGLLYRSKLPVAEYYPTPAETHYLYRWDGTCWHDSGRGNIDSHKRARLFRGAALRDVRFRKGTIPIEPGWRYDYQATVAEALHRPNETAQLREWHPDERRRA